MNANAMFSVRLGPSHTIDFQTWDSDLVENEYMLTRKRLHGAATLHRPPDQKRINVFI